VIHPHIWALVALGVVGVALVALPLLFNMFGRAPEGAEMLTSFRPFMTSTRLAGFQTEIRQINAGVLETKTSVVIRLEVNSDSAARARFDSQFPTFDQFSEQWPGIDAHMSSLLDEVQGNLGNYEAIAALPSFRLFPWFFVIPGFLVVALLGAVVVRPQRWGSIRVVFVVLGIGLIVAPAVFQMFQRAPKGGQMMSAFKGIETAGNIETIQGYFGSMAVGQGAIRLNIVPALEHHGMTPAQVQSQFPAIATLDRNWDHILNDMTPMIGAMSDNVVNYEAIAALPPFPLFPYFFVLPGLFVVAFAIAAGPGRRIRETQPGGELAAAPRQPTIEQESETTWQR
jgi:hypothetical protein